MISRDGKQHVGFDVVETEEEGLIPGKVQWIPLTKSRLHKFYRASSGRGMKYKKMASKADDTELGDLEHDEDMNAAAPVLEALKFQGARSSAVEGESRGVRRT